MSSILSASWRSDSGVKDSINTAWLAEPVSLDLVPERALADLEQSRGSSLVLPRGFEGGFDQATLELIHMRFQGKRLLRRLRRLGASLVKRNRCELSSQFTREMRRGDDLVPAQHYRSLDQVLQFTDISRPRVVLQDRQCLRR